jgi:OmpA-OmpF porin, OOP family
VRLRTRPSRRAHPAPPWRAVVAAGALLVAVSSRGVRAQDADIKGSKDHPVVSRYAGSVIIGYEVRKFDEFQLPLGPVTFEVQPPRYVAARREKAEGRITRILYVAPPQRTTLEVLRNYEQELNKGGFATLYACSATECGAAVNTFSEFIYPRERQLKPNVFALPQEQRYLAAKRTNPDGTTYVSVYVARGGNQAVFGFGRILVMLDVIESVAMDTGMVTVDAAAMAKAITQTGRVALYGILFDTNRAEVKPESQPVLQEIAKLLKQDPALKLLVVGHTDSVGGFDANMALSNRRAAAVLQELTTKHGIAAARVRAVGVGMAAPVAPNDTDDGRAKNRRVELVRQ